MPRSTLSPPRSVSERLRFDLELEHWRKALEAIRERVSSDTRDKRANWAWEELTEALAGVEALLRVTTAMSKHAVMSLNLADAFAQLSNAGDIKRQATKIADDINVIGMGLPDMKDRVYVDLNNRLRYVYDAAKWFIGMKDKLPATLPPNIDGIDRPAPPARRATVAPLRSIAENLSDAEIDKHVRKHKTVTRISTAKRRSTAPARPTR